MSFLKEFRKNEADIKQNVKDNFKNIDDELAMYYLKEIAGCLAAIADEEHEANKLKRLEINDLRSRRHR